MFLSYNCYYEWQKGSNQLTDECMFDNNKVLGFLDSWIDIKDIEFYTSKKNRSNNKIESILVFLIFLFLSTVLLKPALGLV